jgi:ABC-type antimicrobial peptide transport system permease subunit
LLVAVGALVGAVLANLGTDVLSKVVYQANSGDPLVVMGSIFLISVVALAAGFQPARRALRTDAMQTLRHE